MDPIKAPDFALTSSWTVVTGSNGVKEITSGPTTDSRTITFTYELPYGAKVTSAKVHADWGSPLSGFAVHTINGVTPGDDGMVDVTIDPAQTSVNVVFAFKAMGDTTSTGNRSATATMTDVYLLLETTGGTGCIYHAEDGVLVPYNFYHAEGGVLVPYNLFGIPGAYDPDTQSLLTANGAQFLTSLSEQFKVTGGMS